MSPGFSVACLLALLFSTTPTVAQTAVTRTRAVMGTPWTITVYANDTARAATSIARAFLRVAGIEQVASDYRADSEISRLTRLPARRYHRVSEDLFSLLHQSLTLADRSGGAFDPTVGPLSRLWRRAFRQQRFPGQEAIDLARSRVQWRSLRLRRPHLARLSRDDLQLDLGGIAKGYAIDAAAAVLSNAGLSAYLVDGGGDLLLGDSPPGSCGWSVATPAGAIDTANVAIATSGSAYRYLEHEGSRYGHLIDPRTGLGVVHQGSVTVYGPTATLADGLASALSILAPQRHRALLRHYPDYYSLTR